MLSQSSEYALRASLHLARAHPHALRVSDVADAIRAPRNYLSKILGSLVRVGVLESTRGPGGGFRLGRPAAEVCLAEIIEAFESIEERRCLIGRGRCGDKPACAAHSSWAPIADDVERYFADTTLADLLCSPRVLT
jgi:Rrf2 family protein